MRTLTLLTALDRARKDILTNQDTEWLKNAHRQIANPENGWTTTQQIVLLEATLFRLERLAKHADEKNDDWNADIYYGRIGEINQALLKLNPNHSW